MKRIIESEIKCDFLRKKVVAMSHSNNAWFGTVYKRKGKEVMLINARQMHAYMTIKGRGLSAAAINGIDPRKSQINETVDQVWFDYAEIIPCTDHAARSIESAPVLN